LPQPTSLLENTYFSLLLDEDSQELQTLMKLFQNIGEVLGVVKLVCKLMGRGISGHKITILSPYRAQTLLIQNFVRQTIETKQKIKNPVEKMGWNPSMLANVVIATIDSYQGQENDYVVLSLVRSNDEGNLGFISNPQRMLVALSRARLQLTVVCNCTTLAVSAHSQWGTFLKSHYNVQGIHPLIQIARNANLKRFTAAENGPAKKKRKTKGKLHVHR
jgi:hypothetical protein